MREHHALRAASRATREEHRSKIIGVAHLHWVLCKIIYQSLQVNVRLVARRTDDGHIEKACFVPCPPNTVKPLLISYKDPRFGPRDDIGELRLRECCENRDDHSPDAPDRLVHDEDLWAIREHDQDPVSALNSVAG